MKALIFNKIHNVKTTKMTCREETCHLFCLKQQKQWGNQMIKMHSNAFHH